MSRPPGSNYATGPWGHPVIPSRPTEWEMLLDALELTESQAQFLLQRTGSKALRLRLWIERHHRHRYVPPQFLSDAQMEEFTW